MTSLSIAPPPSATTPPRSSAPTTRRSSTSRKRASPTVAKKLDTERPASAAISPSVSVKSRPRLRAMRLPAVDLPAPMKPTSAIDPLIVPCSLKGRSGYPRGPRESAAEVDPLAVGVERPADVVDVVAAELLAVGAGEDEREHRLADYARGRDHG